ncbi:MAG: SWIM zinc finger family protein [Bacteroidota bacterium]
MTPLDFGTDLVRAHTTEKVYGRAEAIVAAEDILRLVRRGDRLEAAVQGSDVRPYRVRVPLTARGVGDPRCTCPYSFGGWCKHVAAVMLSAIEMPHSIEVEPPLDEIIEAQTEAGVKAALLALAEAHPEMADEIEARVQGLEYEPPEWDLGDDYGW